MLTGETPGNGSKYFSSSFCEFVWDNIIGCQKSLVVFLLNFVHKIGYNNAI